MQGNGEVIETIREGGSGSEANIKVQLRTAFPGLGGTILTREGVAAALREEYNRTPKSGHRMFIRHVIIKKLDDYFYRTGVYVFSHIPRPFGSISKSEEVAYEAYLYEWAFGAECFPWEYIDSNGNRSLIKLRDWNSFISHFDAAGIDLNMDTTDPDNGRISQNVIHQYPNPVAFGEMCSLWKRIDFGFKSIKIDTDRLTKFLYDKREELTMVLRSERYQMLSLALKYLTKRESMRELDIGRLEELLGDYRRSNLSHYALGFGPAETPAYFGKRTESLL